MVALGRAGVSGCPPSRSPAEQAHPDKVDDVVNAAEAGKFLDLALGVLDAALDVALVVDQEGGDIAVVGEGGAVDAVSGEGEDEVQAYAEAEVRVERDEPCDEGDWGKGFQGGEGEEGEEGCEVGF